MGRWRPLALLPLLLLLFLALSSPCGGSSSSFRSRRLQRTLGGGGGSDPPDAAVELNATSFDAVLGASPARFAVVEFFANWCPACRNYKPQYERVSKLFNGPDAAHPGFVIMTRVDCALKINTKLCSRFSVSHYPMLFWGPPTKFAYGDWDPKQEKMKIKTVDDGRTADRLLSWINKQLGSSFSLEDEKYENEISLLYNASNPEEIARALYDVEEATTNAFEIILEHKMIKPETRSPLIKFLQLLVAHHPSKRCREGSSDILVNFDEMWPAALLALTSSEAITSHQKEASKMFHICGKEVPRGYWIFCRGSKKDTRGLSCGLWVLLHSLSIRVADGESHLAFTTICDFIHNFFVCEECRQHFYGMCSSVSTPFNSTRDLSLWFWSTHNKVNERLSKEESALKTGDPNFPKMVWPPKKLCPSCYVSSSRTSNGTFQVDWNNDEVFKFLVDYYGTKLISSYKDAGLSSSRSLDTEIDDTATNNAVAVPLGAALAIAFASCGFGALASFWRTKQKNQKNRKYLHQTHPLKNK